MSGHKLTGQVALVEDDYTLVINRGAQAGVTQGMVFAVYSDTGQVITDPESGRELGRLRREELRVRVFDVQPLFARAHTVAKTDDFYGLLQLPFVEQTDEHIVTVNVGDAVALVGGQAAARRSNSTGT
ncbi:MAG: hypothetical protein WBB07_05595 [Mycobacterium sp.]